MINIFVVLFEGSAFAREVESVKFKVWLVSVKQEVALSSLKVITL